MSENRINFAEYQKRAKETVVYPYDTGLLYTTLGLTSEAGEVAGVVKRILRDDAGRLGPLRRDELVTEAGDVLWYLAMLCEEAGVSLQYVAERNLHKLADRQTRGTLHGQGGKR